jgi:thiamine biosynthesis lipoprotein
VNHGFEPSAPTELPAFGDARPLRDVPRAVWVEQIMGMPISVHVRSDRPRDKAVQTAVDRVFAELRHVDAVFSTWRAESQVSRLRRGELTLAGCGTDVREVADLCEQARVRTEGWFDADLPDPDGVRRFDPTGLVKGWAVERASRLLADLGGTDFMINAGGDIVVGCTRTDTPDWRLGIEDPADRSRILLAVPLRVGGMATSGTAARGTHIIAPPTGRPVEALGSVTVLGPSLMWADVYATAAFARGPGCLDWLRTLDRHAAVVVDLDGIITTTP